MDFSKYKCIIYDWNGTLMNDVQLCIDLLNVLMDKYSLPRVGYDKYREIFTFPIIDYYANAGLVLSPQEFEQVADEVYSPMYNARFREASLADGAEDFLKDMQSRGICQVILSASKQNMLDEEVDYYGIRDYFSSVYGNDNCYASSKVDVAKRFLSEHSFPVNEVLFIGDTVHDYEVAQEIGCDVVLLSSGHQSERILSETQAPIYSGFSQLLNQK